MTARLVLVVTLANAGACSHGKSSKSGSDGGSLSVELVGSPAAAYPCDIATCYPTLNFSYQVTLTTTGPGLQDLQVWIPPPASTVITAATIDNGRYDTGNGLLELDVDWLDSSSLPVVATASFSVNVNPFSEVATDPHGDLLLPTQATVTQYDVPLATSAMATAIAYLPIKLTSVQMTVYSAMVDGTYAYVSALPSSGTYTGQGGVYRITLSDGTFQQVAHHAMTPADTLPFVLDGSTIYYVTHTTDPTNTVLMSIASDGSGAATPVPLPAGTLSVRAVGADATYLFVVIVATDLTEHVYRATKSDLSGASVTSAALGTLENDTMAITTDQVMVMRTDTPAPAILKLDKATLTPTKLVDVGYPNDERTMACSDDYCFWADTVTYKLSQIPLAGGTTVALTGSTQRIVFDGTYVYTGVGGMVRVGPNQMPPLQKLFATYYSTVHAFDANYVYFTNYGSNDLWKIHK